MEVERLLEDLAMLLKRYPTGSVHEHLASLDEHLRKDLDYARDLKALLVVAEEN